MKLLVSGATGFIGSHLTKRLVAEGHEVFAIVRASTDTETLTQNKITPIVQPESCAELITCMETEKFDGVLHLASLFLAQHKPEDIKGLIDSNVLFSTLLLEASVKSSIPWFINTGTFWQHFENAPYSPVNLYAATKQAFESIAAYYLETSPINFVTLKLSDTFGPGDIRPKVFNLWLKVAKTGEVLEMSPGDQKLDISYIDNVIDGFIQLVALMSGSEGTAFRGKFFALKSGNVAPLKEIAAIFEKVTNLKLNIVWGAKPYRPREVMEPWNTGETIPGWSPNISLEEGIARTFNE